jgi:fumarate hydratase, class I
MNSPSDNLTKPILELIRLASTDLPAEVEKLLSNAALQEEDDSAARFAMDAIQMNIKMTRRDSFPICQDTGTPLFFVTFPEGWSQRRLRSQIREAVAEATKRSYLRPNAVESLHGRNSGDNLGDEFFPTIHFEESNDGHLSIDLLLKGGGCENVGAQYSLPDERLQAGRDLEGVGKVVLDSVFQAQGQGCAPGSLGVAIGGDRGTGYLDSKKSTAAQVR